MAKSRYPLEPSDAEIKKARLKERADDAAQATADYKAMQEARRINTERLRALRLAKEAKPPKKSRDHKRRS